MTVRRINHCSFVLILAAQLGQCSCSASSTGRPLLQKQPNKCYCPHLIDLSQAHRGPDTARRAGAMARSGRAGKQAPQCVRRRWRESAGQCRWLRGTVGLAQGISSHANTDVSCDCGRYTHDGIQATVWPQRRIRGLQESTKKIQY
uniref:Secreted protein n=1 Tax=Knipowitschia caucasica TaxID=637954 RepID=A0AAV2LFP0_KNICA